MLQKKIYKDQAELMIVNHVFPTFNSAEGYLRARVSRIVIQQYLRLLICLQL